MDKNVYLSHHGIIGQKWGVRRYQNPDGSLTSLGKEHYGSGNYRRKKQRKSNGEIKKIAKNTAKATAVGLLGGLATGAVTYGIATINPALLGTSTITLVGRTAVIAAANAMFQTGIKEVASYESTKHGERFVDSSLTQKNR